MAELRAVLFDVYGTLIDIKTDEHRDDVFESLSRFLEYRRVSISAQPLKELYFDQINRQIAESREKFPEVDVSGAFAHILRDTGGVNDRYLAMLMTQLYRSLCREHMRLFDDTFWTLNKFRRKYRLGIVSDAQRLFCLPELRTLRLEHFFDAVVISSDYGFRKPDPRVFHIALAMINVPPSEAAYIGNSFETDLIGAKDAGLAMTGLIHQSDQKRKAYPEGYAPDFVADDLRGALKAISEQSVAG
ncbi:MAG: HAD family hydrolase [Candidatus Latescibacterota bacterium]